MREVVTVQLGGYANYVGSHFWNLQDEAVAQDTAAGVRELSPNIFFHETRNRLSQLSFIPRLQIVDLTGAFGSLRSDGRFVVDRQTAANQVDDANEPRSEDLLWDGAVQRYAKPHVPVSSFIRSVENEDEISMAERQNPEGMYKQSLDAGDDKEDGVSPDFGLDSNVRYWSDYLKVRLHARTSCSVPAVHYGVNDFGLFGSGVAAATGNMLDATFNDLRYFIEQCDSFGGLVVNCDVNGGFSGFAERYLAHITEEVGTSVPIVMLGAASFPPSSPTSEFQSIQTELIQRSLNEALLFAATTDHNAQYIPLRAAATANFPYVHPQLQTQFQTSAALGIGLDVALTPLRHVDSRVILTGWLASIRPAPFANLSSIGLAVPISSSVTFQRSAIREVAGMVRLSSPQNGVCSTSQGSGVGSYNASGNLPARELVCGRGVGGDVDMFCRASTRIAVPVPFPRFFDRRIDMRGHLIPLEVASKRPRLGEVGELSALASLYVDTDESSLFFSDMGVSLDRAIRAPASLRGLLEAETIREMAENIRGLASDYLTL
jgi:hypothetical protein